MIRGRTISLKKHILEPGSTSFVVWSVIVTGDRTRRRYNSVGHVLPSEIGGVGQLTRDEAKQIIRTSREREK
jgi:hypothetical protein